VDVAWFDDTSQGLIVGRSAGTAIVTATTEDGAYTATCVVVVTEGEKTIVNYTWFTSVLRHKVHYADGTWAVEDCAPSDCVCGRQYNNINAPTIYIDSASASAGKTVELNVSLKNNPGVAFLTLSLEYDSSIFTLVNVKNGDLISDMDQGVNLLWTGDSDATGDGVLCTLTFAVAENAAEGEFTISAKCREAYNDDFEDVTFAVEAGSVKIIDCVYGDANGDGVVNGRDVLLLRKYMANYDYDKGVSSVSVDLGADANGDGVVNGRDVLLMRKYMANYDYDTGSSSVVLGPR
jgi:hypothetical protein